MFVLNQTHKEIITIQVELLNSMNRDFIATTYKHSNDHESHLTQNDYRLPSVHPLLLTHPSYAPSNYTCARCLSLIKSQLTNTPLKLHVRTVFHLLGSIQTSGRIHEISPRNRYFRINLSSDNFVNSAPGHEWTFR